MSPELEGQIVAYRRPFDVENGVHHGVAARPVGEQLMAAQHTVELGAEAFDRRPAPAIEEVGAEFDSDATELVERVREHQQLGLGVDPPVRRADAEYQVWPISSRRLAASTWNKLEDPTTTPSARRRIT